MFFQHLFHHVHRPFIQPVGTGALRKRGELDNNTALMDFADALEDAGLQTMEDGVMSQDLAVLCDPADVVDVPDNAGLLKAIRSRLEANLAEKKERLSA